jgi:hypothetical protein
VWQLGGNRAFIVQRFGRRDQKQHGLTFTQSKKGRMKKGQGPIHGSGQSPWPCDAARQSA